MERLWHWLKSHCLSNRIYRDVEHLYDAAAQAWNTVTTDRFKTVCRTPYMGDAGFNENPYYSLLATRLHTCPGFPLMFRSWATTVGPKVGL